MGYSVSYIGLWILVIFQFFVCAGLLREVRLLRSMPELDRLPIGTRAPNFAGIDLSTGERVSTKAYSGKSFVILLVSPSCHACSRLLGSLRLGVTAGVPLLIVCSGDESTCRTLSPAPPRAKFLAGTDSDVRKLFGISGSPTAISVDGEGSIKGYAQPKDAEQLTLFVAKSIGLMHGIDTAPVSGARVGV
jgi:hypothetical protein